MEFYDITEAIRRYNQQVAVSLENAYIKAESDVMISESEIEPVQKALFYGAKNVLLAYLKIDQESYKEDNPENFLNETGYQLLIEETENVEVSEWY